MSVRAQRPGRWGLLGLLVATVAAAGVGCGTSSDESAGIGFDVMERSITELAAALGAGEVTSRELVAS